MTDLQEALSVRYAYSARIVCLTSGAFAIFANHDLLAIVPRLDEDLVRQAFDRAVQQYQTSQQHQTRPPKPSVSSFLKELGL